MEIGPGKGVLTKYLLEHDIQLKGVDADRDMIKYLHKAYPEKAENFILDDCLKINFFELFDGEPFLVIGNFPYNISSQIVFKIIKNKELVPEMVGMFQKEMADRIIAPHGSKTYGVISILTQAHYSCDHVMDVGNQNFTPPPKVQSSVIRLTRKDTELNCDPSFFKAIVKSTFNQRRKMIRNTLSALVEDREVLQDSYFDHRPEQLSVEDFVALTNKLEKFKQS